MSFLEFLFCLILASVHFACTTVIAFSHEISSSLFKLEPKFARKFIKAKFINSSHGAGAYF